MDNVRFDALARAFGSVVNRRATARVVVGGALGALGLAAGRDAAAKKKKKKCKKPKVKCGKKCCAAGSVCVSGACAPGCKFTKTATLWTLQASCTTTSTIEIPDGVTLDGDGKTITLPSNNSVFNLAAGVKASAVRDLGVVGSGSTVSCDFAGIELQGSAGESNNFTVSNFPCGRGIYCATGVFSVVDATIEDVAWGVEVIGGCEVTITNSTVTNAGLGLAAATTPAVLIATNNVIVGPGSIQGGAGIAYEGGTSGSAAGNTISNFLDGGSSATSCGISVSELAEEVTLGANTFPDPPGNEQNVCDFRP